MPTSMRVLCFCLLHMLLPFSLLLAGPYNEDSALAAFRTDTGFEGSIIPSGDSRLFSQMTGIFTRKDYQFRNITDTQQPIGGIYLPDRFSMDHGEVSLNAQVLDLACRIAARMDLMYKPTGLPWHLEAVDYVDSTYTATFMQYYGKAALNGNDYSLRIRYDRDKHTFLITNDLYTGEIPQPSRVIDATTAKQLLNRIKGNSIHTGETSIPLHYTTYDQITDSREEGSPHLYLMARDTTDVIHGTDFHPYWALSWSPTEDRNLTVFIDAETGEVNAIGKELLTYREKIEKTWQPFIRKYGFKGEIFYNLLGETPLLKRYIGYVYGTDQQQLFTNIYGKFSTLKTKKEKNAPKAADKLAAALQKLFQAHGYDIVLRRTAVEAPLPNEWYYLQFSSTYPVLSTGHDISQYPNACLKMVYEPNIHSWQIDNLLYMLPLTLPKYVSTPDNFLNESDYYELTWDSPSAPLSKYPPSYRYENKKLGLSMRLVWKLLETDGGIAPQFSWEITRNGSTTYQYASAITPDAYAQEQAAAAGDASAQSDIDNAAIPEQMIREIEQRLQFSGEISYKPALHTFATLYGSFAPPSGTSPTLLAQVEAIKDRIIQYYLYQGYNIELRLLPEYSTDADYNTDLLPAPGVKAAVNDYAQDAQDYYYAEGDTAAPPVIDTTYTAPPDESEYPEGSDDGYVEDDGYDEGDYTEGDNTPDVDDVPKNNEVTFTFLQASQGFDIGSYYMIPTLFIRYNYITNAWDVNNMLTLGSFNLTARVVDPRCLEYADDDDAAHLPRTFIWQDTSGYSGKYYDTPYNEDLSLLWWQGWEDNPASPYRLSWMNEDRVYDAYTGKLLFYMPAD